AIHRSLARSFAGRGLWARWAWSRSIIAAAVFGNDLASARIQIGRSCPPPSSVLGKTFQVCSLVRMRACGSLPACAGVSANNPSTIAKSAASLITQALSFSRFGDLLDRRAGDLLGDFLRCRELLNWVGRLGLGRWSFFRRGEIVVPLGAYWWRLKDCRSAVIAAVHRGRHQGDRPFPVERQVMMGHLLAILGYEHVGVFC